MSFLFRVDKTPESCPSPRRYTCRCCWTRWSNGCNLGRARCWSTARSAARATRRRWPPRWASEGLLIGIDRDPAAIDAAAQELRGLPVRLAQANFCDLPEVLEQLKIEKVDGVVLDLGLSSDQLADRSRGFSFSSDGPLDLRFDPTSGEPARRLINRLSVEHLTATDFELRRGAIQPADCQGDCRAAAREADRDGGRAGRIGPRLRAQSAGRIADRPGHADVSGPANCGQRRIEIAGDRPAAHSRLPAAGRRGWRSSVFTRWRTGG